jgi:hypothetical protein
MAAKSANVSRQPESGRRCNCRALICESVYDDRGNAIVPGMPVGKATIAEILNAGLKLLTSASEVAIIKDDDSRVPHQLDG